jgi:hypothetical protein
MKQSPRLIFVWIGESRRAAAAGDVDSVFFFKLDPDDEDEQPVWFHDACRDVVSASIEEIESAARQRARDGVYQISKFQGRSVIKIDPDLEALGFEGTEAYMRGADGKVVYEQVWTPPSNELTLGVLAAYSRRYKKQQQGGATVTVNTAYGGGVVTVGGENRPQITALPQVQIVDSEPAEFTELSLDEILGPEPELPDEPDDSFPEPTPDGVGVIDRAAAASIPAGMRAEWDKLVARGAIRPDGATIGTTVAPVVIATVTPSEYSPEPNPLIRPTNGKPLSDAERALLSRLPGSLNRK